MKKIIIFLAILTVINAYADIKYVHAVQKSGNYTWVFEPTDNECTEAVISVHDGEIKEISIARDLFIANVYFTDGHKISIHDDGSSELYNEKEEYVSRKRLGKGYIKDTYKCLTSRK